jgi:hypothetical protein
MTNLVHFPDRVLGHEVVPGKELILDHRKHQRGGSHFKISRSIAKVRVANYDMESSKQLRIGVWLIAGIDYGTLERGLEAYFNLEKVGALANLIPQLAGVLADS